MLPCVFLSRRGLPAARGKQRDNLGHPRCRDGVLSGLSLLAGTFEHQSSRAPSVQCPAKQPGDVAARSVAELFAHTFGSALADVHQTALAIVVLGLGAFGEYRFVTACVGSTDACGRRAFRFDAAGHCEEMIKVQGAKRRGTAASRSRVMRGVVGLGPPMPAVGKSPHAKSAHGASSAPPRVCPRKGVVIRRRCWIGHEAQARGRPQIRSGRRPRRSESARPRRRSGGVCAEDRDSMSEFVFSLSAFRRMDIVFRVLAPSQPKHGPLCTTSGRVRHQNPPDVCQGFPGFGQTWSEVARD